MGDIQVARSIGVGPWTDALANGGGDGDGASQSKGRIMREGGSQGR